MENQVGTRAGGCSYRGLGGAPTESSTSGWSSNVCAKRCRHPTMKDKTVWEVFEEERAYLMAYRGAFDGFHAMPTKVSPTLLVRFDNNLVNDN